ncbi:MAG TPA: prepilin-type N-terminal cleavage/methylation domain-containing protein [Syntrophales bacterium]|nr:prepilin-type N-terminal cleavage/methylation domain-containing protein [Syntrophales bacterium]
MISSARNCPFFVRSKEQQGFTVLEILVSLMIISIVAVSIIQLTSMNLRNLTRSGDEVNALLIANSKMRTLLEMDKMDDKFWREIDEQGNTYEIWISEIRNKRTESLPVKLEGITLTLHYPTAQREKTVTLNAEKVFSAREQAKITKNPLP